MGRKKTNRYSGVGGQAVLEGVMMKNKEQYAVAVRKPDGEIEIEVENYQGVMHGSKLKEVPFIRGVFNFVDSMMLGTKCLNYSASFYEDDEAEETLTDKALNKLFKGKAEKVLSVIVTIVAILFSVGLFIILPYFISSLLDTYIRNASLLAIVEGVVRIAIFILYIVAITAMDDIKRLYMYHGAEHKCINCIEKGRPLNVENAMRSSRLHKRCGTSFMFFVLFISIILFFFIRVENPAMRVVVRLLLIPVLAGISYEIIRLAGKSDNIIVKLFSAPGMMIQRLTTKEPTSDMVEVAIASVEAVFDWKAYLQEHFGYDENELLQKEAQSEVSEDEK